MLKKIISGVSAGLLISIGGAVFLACDNRYVGAVLFSVALLCICLKGYSLFTGKVGFLPEKHGKEEISVLLLGLAGNVIGTLIGGKLIRLGLPALGAAADALCAAKMAGQTLPQCFVRALFCGILMYLAVSIYRDQKTVVGILYCIPVFILSGFEHSIADMFYFAASGRLLWGDMALIIVVILGNAAGGMLLPALGMMGKKEKEHG
ncbi:MAG: formate/nitrite transporter family protein [Clostridia bacterium]|nr:formate/nitrite transporter family protein [Clostridia bacterium]